MTMSAVLAIVLAIWAVSCVRRVGGAQAIDRLNAIKVLALALAATVAAAVASGFAFGDGGFSWAWAMAAAVGVVGVAALLDVCAVALLVWACAGGNFRVAFDEIWPRKSQACDDRH